nr:helix-turn-helix domain-containing protein [Microbacterium endophyticum]
MADTASSATLKAKRPPGGCSREISVDGCRKRSPTRITPGRCKSLEALVDALLTSKHVSRILGVSEPTLCRWRKAGSGPPVVTVGGIYRYRPAALESWIEGQEL